MAQKAIVGGGISGLIWGFFHHQWVMFSKQMGGQFSDEWTGPRLLHDHPETRFLLKSLDLPIVPKEAKVGYWYGGKVHPDCPPEARILYYRKSRGLSGATEVPSSVMSGGEGVIRYLDVNWRSLIASLINRGIGAHKIIHQEVETLEPSGNYLVVNGTYAFSELVWTPPLPILLKKLNLENPYRGINKTFILTEEFKDFPLGDYRYVYVPGPEFSYHRITRVPSGVVLEWTGDQFDFGSLSRAYPELKKSKKHKTLKGAQLVPSEVDPYFLGIPDRIRLLGRFAEWKHSIKIEDVIRKASSEASLEKEPKE